MASVEYSAIMPWGERLAISVDLSQASSQIYYLDDDGKRITTPFQTADARHDAHKAMRLVIEFLGSDWYASPDDDRDDGDIVDGIIRDLEIESEDDE